MTRHCVDSSGHVTTHGRVSFRNIVQEGKGGGGGGTGGFGRWGTPKFGLTWGVAKNNYGGLRACSPIIYKKKFLIFLIFFFFLMDALRLVLRHSGCTNTQF